MAKKKKNVTLENVELKPQVIGTIYKKKNNIFRVFIIFVIFGLVVYYINDVSVFINDLLGKVTATTISENTESGKTSETSNNTQNGEEESNETELFTYSEDLAVTYEELTFSNFSYENGMLTFDIINNTEYTVSYSSIKLFIELYSEGNTLLNRYKIDIDSIASENKISYSFDVSEELYYIALVEKTEDDYPLVSLVEDESGASTLTCTNDHEVIEYTFTDSELTNISHIVTYNDADENYNVFASAYQSKVTEYNNYTGVSATFSNDSTSFTAEFDIILNDAVISSLNEKYYFSYLEEPKVVSFEMATYGFTCS